MSVLLNFWSVQDIQLRICRRQITPVDLLRACIGRIDQREPQVHAWQYLALEQAWKHAVEWDQRFQESNYKEIQAVFRAYPLAGIPVAIKDIFAILDMPTGWGTTVYRGRYLDHEAAVVAQLKAAGAIILGKTVTTELATAASGLTANPHHLAHTPGGSSSGSAAAVADGMVPLAIGSQTMGSILRPAAYCGIFGFKPSFGLISRDGMMPVCDDLDQVGFFARNLNDIQHLLLVLTGQNARVQSGDGGNLLTYSKKSWEDKFAPGLPRLALVKTPHWDRLETVARNRLDEAVEGLKKAGISVEFLNLSPILEDYWNTVQTLCAYGLKVNHQDFIENHPEHCSESLKNWLRLGQQISVFSYEKAFQKGNFYRQVKWTPEFRQF
jgi:Asp-tRNA(Asn)/Glu-tRNA(Gln) amidotransferase A subunit family amidase